METIDAIGISGTIALLISLFRDAAFLGLLKDIFVKPHHPDDLNKIETLTLERDDLQKDKEIAEAVSKAMDNPDLQAKEERIRKVLTSGKSYGTKKIDGNL
tara:strand:- start:707 stop:1009 length:303 start_codon:yes stop_codon:yes gene_type:complete